MIHNWSERMINHSGNEKGPHEQSIVSSAESWTMVERLIQLPITMKLRLKS